MSDASDGVVHSSRGRTVRFEGGGEGGNEIYLFLRFQLRSQS